MTISSSRYHVINSFKRNGATLYRLSLAGTPARVFETYEQAQRALIMGNTHAARIVKHFA